MTIEAAVTPCSWAEQPRVRMAADSARRVRVVGEQPLQVLDGRGAGKQPTHPVEAERAVGHRPQRHVLPGEARRDEVVRVNEDALDREEEAELRVVAGHRLDVRGEAVGVRQQVAGRGRAPAALDHGQRLGDRLRAEDCPQHDVVRNARLAAVCVRRQRVRREPETCRVHARLGEQAGLDDGDERRPFVGLRLEHHHRLERVRVPVPVLRDDRLTAGARLREERDGRAAACRAERRPGLRRIDDLRADVQREHVDQVDRGPLGDPAELLGARLVEGRDRLLEAGGFLPDALPAPAGERSEQLAIPVDGPANAVASLLAVGASPLARSAANPDVWVGRRHGGHGSRAPASGA